MPPRLGSAADAAAVICAVFGDDQWRRFGKIRKHLPGDMALRHGCGQRFTARSARLGIMVNRDIRGFGAAKRRAWMALLSAGLSTRSRDCDFGLGCWAKNIVLVSLCGCLGWGFTIIGPC